MEGDLIWQFTPSNRWSLKNHILSGICFFAWIKLLWRFRSDVSGGYLHRIVFITFMSIINSILALPDTFFYSKEIEKQTINPRPVFILGHPRTGTTHLHNLLSLHKDQFTFSNTFQVGFPSSFLCCEKIGSTLLAPILDKKRPMDNMTLSFKIPQEDELASNVLSSGCSPYMPLMFPQKEKFFRRFFTFEEPECSTDDFKSWKSSFIYFLKKLTLKAKISKKENADDLRLLIKSPVHTGRVKLLLELFPDAQFLYIHRNPYEVFQSAVHMADSYYWFCHLQEATSEAMTEFILYQYDLLFAQYIKERDLIPPENRYELSFHDLDHDPVTEIQKIYEHFQWDGFGTLLPTIQGYTSSLQDFKKNDHVALPIEWKRLIYQRWKDSFKEFGYTE